MRSEIFVILTARLIGIPRGWEGPKPSFGMSWKE